MFKILCCLLLVVNVCQARIKFIHIPKTGGTSVRVLLDSFFKKNQRYSAKFSPLVPFPKTREDAKSFPGFDCELIDGHFPYWFMVEKEESDKSSFIFTTLREPVQRVLSHYRYMKKRSPGKDIKIEYIEDNLICHMLSSDPEFDGEELLQSAINNLHKIDFIIFMDNFEKDVRLLFNIMGGNIRHRKFPHVNTTKKETYSAEMIQGIKKRNALDIALYQYAKEHFSRLK